MNTNELIVDLATKKQAIQANFSQERIENMRKKIAELQQHQEIFELLSGNGIDILLDCSSKMAAHELIQKSQMDTCKKIFSFAGSLMEIATILAKGNTKETQGNYDVLVELNKSLETYPLVYDFTSKEEFENGLIKVIDDDIQAGYVQKWQNPKGEYQLREVLFMAPAKAACFTIERKILRNIDEDGVIIEKNPKELYGCAFYLAVLEDDGKINFQDIGIVKKARPSDDNQGFLNDEFAMIHDQYGNLIAKKIRDEQGKFTGLKFIQHRKFCKDKEIFL